MQKYAANDASVSVSGYCYTVHLYIAATPNEFDCNVVRWLLAAM